MSNSRSGRQRRSPVTSLSTFLCALEAHFLALTGTGRFERPRPFPAPRKLFFVFIRHSKEARCRPVENGLSETREDRLRGSLEAGSRYVEGKRSSLMVRGPPRALLRVLRDSRIRTDLVVGARGRRQHRPFKVAFACSGTSALRTAAQPSFRAARLDFN